MNENSINKYLPKNGVCGTIPNYNNTPTPTSPCIGDVAERRTTQVTEQLKRLDRNISQLFESQALLESVLGGVLRAQGPQCGTEACDKVQLVGLAEILNQYNIALENLNQTKRSMLERIEL